ncbi:MAG: NAD(P)-dependent oxidoreductase [Clostridium sp.]
MFGDDRKDIQNEIAYTFLSFFSQKMRIGVIGGGKAGFIKVRHFVKNKCYVEVLSNEFIDEITELSYENENLKLIHQNFNEEFLKDKHIIIIVLNDDSLRNKIKKYCDDNYKIYIDCTDFKKGMAVVPTERSTRTMNFALNTKGGNPKGSVWAADKISEILKEDDDFIEFTTKIRNRAKNIPEYKKEIIQFIFTDEFKKLFDKGEAVESIRSRFPKEVIDKLF